MYRRNPENRPIQHYGGAGFTPAVETNILGANLVPKSAPSLLRIFIAVGTDAKFYATMTRSGTANQVIFNSDVNLTADCLYAFDLLTSTLDTAITFQTDALVDIISLTIQEILIGGQ